MLKTGVARLATFGFLASFTLGCVKSPASAGLTSVAGAPSPPVVVPTSVATTAVATASAATASVAAVQPASIVTQLTATPPVWAGGVNAADLLSISGGWRASHDQYQPDSAALARLRGALQAHSGLRLVVILGAWCGDSRRHVPELVKVQGALGAAALPIQYVGVNRQKTQPAGVAARYGIRKFPTFIVLRGDTEVGRVIEIPKVSIEADLAEIITGADTVR